MAIKIIKNTMVDPTEMTCECCKSVFTYTFEDIQRREESLFLGMSVTTRRYVTCPVCKYDNDVNSVIVKLHKNKETESEDKSEKDAEFCVTCSVPEETAEKEEAYCTECPHFEDVAECGNSWFGARCKLDGHESAPSMYAIQSLHNDCPLKKEGTE